MRSCCNPKGEKGCSHLPLVLMPVWGCSAAGQGRAWVRCESVPCVSSFSVTGSLLCPHYGFYCCFLGTGWTFPLCLLIRRLCVIRYQAQTPGRVLVRDTPLVCDTCLLGHKGTVTFLLLCRSPSAVVCSVVWPCVTEWSHPVPLPLRPVAVHRAQVLALNALCTYSVCTYSLACASV